MDVGRKEMKASIIISIYNSHEAVRRQILYFRKMKLPDDVEFIFVDDGSNPPLKGRMKNLRIIRTNNKLAWTQGLGRNLGASVANGEYLLFTDIDHILSREAIEAVRTFGGDKMSFKRYVGVITTDGDFTQDMDILLDHGFNIKRKYRNGVYLYASIHGNTYAIKKSTFDLLGGYNETFSGLGYRPQIGHRNKAEDNDFNGRWNKWARKNNILPEIGPDIYMFPVGNYHVDESHNPMGLFHDLDYFKNEPFEKC